MNKQRRAHAKRVISYYLVSGDEAFCIKCQTAFQLCACRAFETEDYWLVFTPELRELEKGVVLSPKVGI